MDKIELAKGKVCDCIIDTICKVEFTTCFHILCDNIVTCEECEISKRRLDGRIILKHKINDLLREGGLND